MDGHHYHYDYHPRSDGWRVGLSAAHHDTTGKTAGSGHAVFICHWEQGMEDTSGDGKPRLLVLKLGGTAVGSAPRVRDAAQLVAAERDRPRVVGVSAVSGVTNTLLEGVEHAAAGRDPDVQGILAKLRAIHQQVATVIADPDDR